MSQESIGQELVNTARLVVVFVVLLIGVLLVISNYSGGRSDSSRLALVSTNTPTVFPTSQVTPFGNNPARTIAPPSGTTTASIVQSSIQFFNNAPETIGRWTLDKTKSYAVQQHPGGAVLIYNLPGHGDIQITYWLMSSQGSGYNINNAIARFKLESSLIKVPTTNVALGDQALISPTNRQPQQKNGANPTVLAILQWRYMVIDVYATPDLLKSDFDFSDAEATEFLTKMFGAVPKPENAPTPTP